MEKKGARAERRARFARRIFDLLERAKTKLASSLCGNPN
jgi:hypothetical protein